MISVTAHGKHPILPRPPVNVGNHDIVLHDAHPNAKRARWWQFIALHQSAVMHDVIVLWGWGCGSYWGSGINADDPPAGPILVERRDGSTFAADLVKYDAIWRPTYSELSITIRNPRKHP